MTRLLFWIALIILVVAAVRSKLRAAIARAQEPESRPGPGPASAARGGQRRVEDESERMTSCARCGVYFPASEAVTVDGRDYCSPDHARAHTPAR